MTKTSEATRSNWLSEAITAEAIRRLPQSLFGQAIFAAGLGLMVVAGAGLPSWEILHQGLGKVFGITIGQAAQLSGLVVILLWIPIRQRPGLGTLSNIVAIGWVMDIVIRSLGLLGLPADLWTSNQQPLAILFTLVGTALVGLGSGIYIGSGNGPGPRDGLMTGLHRRTGRQIWQVRTAIEVVVGILGFVLGGTFGFGTIWFAFTIGPQVQFWLARLDRGGRAEAQAALADRR
ncbi:MAG: YczE/YyaS/YitT family protein [Candidatus Limnocylindrus sp.]